MKFGAILAFVLPFVASFGTGFDRAPWSPPPTAPIALAYKDSPVMTKPINIYLIYFGKFKPQEKAVIEDFVRTLDESAHWVSWFDA